MPWDKFIGPATIVYLIGATFAAIWWASDINSAVERLEQSTVTAERIARLEIEVRQASENTRELKVSINDLVRELRRNP